MIEAKVHMSSHNKEPFFSIVIPLYNSEQYISDCIESIINQTYKNFEIIVVDDGSTDNGYEICHNIQQKYSELHVFRQQNSGTYNARLNGIRQSKGRYFLFVDSDDMIREDTLEGLHSIITKWNCDIVMFNGSKDADYASSFLLYPFSDFEVFAEEGKSKLYSLICSSKVLNSLATKCISKELVDRIKLEWINSFIHSEDLYFVIPCIDQANMVVYTSERYYYYRSNSLSTTHNYNRDFFESVKRTNKRCLDYAKKWGKENEVKAKGRASHACVFAVMYTLCSRLSDDECFLEVERIVHDPFFIESIQEKPTNSTRSELLLYIILKKKMLRNNKLILKMFRRLIGKA